VTDINNQRQYWDSVAWEKSFTHPLNLDVLRNTMPADGRILDYGCGYGRTVNELLDHGYPNVVGIDSSPLMIERGRRMYPHLNLQVLPDSGLTYEDQSFDAILLFAVLTCIPTNEGQQKLLKNLTRLLRPRGLLYISDYCLQEDERNRQRYEKFADEFGVHGIFRLPEGAILRHHSSEWIEALTSEFKFIHLSQITVATMNESLAKGFQYVGEKGRPGPAQSDDSDVGR
jgi:SAM-dependent methyltransferase